MEPTAELIQELYEEEVTRARAMSFEEKLLAGGELFDYACDITRAGIRMQNPDYDHAQVEAELGRRLAMASAFEESA